MACTEWQTKLDRYVDSELPPDDAAALSAHLATCSACAAWALSRMNVKRAVQKSAHAHYPSSEFRSKIRGQISGRSSSRSAWLISGLVTASLALIMVISLGAVLYRQPAKQLVSEIADLHVSNLASGNPVDVVSSDRHTVKPWFQGKVPFTFDLPELGGTDFTLVGGRLVFVEREPTALLLFKYRSHFLSVFVMPDRAPFTRMGDSLRRQAAFTVQSWDQSGLRYILITDTDAAQAQRLSTLLRSTFQK